MEQTSYLQSQDILGFESCFRVRHFLHELDFQV